MKKSIVVLSIVLLCGLITFFYWLAPSEQLTIKSDNISADSVDKTNITKNNTSKLATVRANSDSQVNTLNADNNTALTLQSENTSNSNKINHKLSQTAHQQSATSDENIDPAIISKRKQLFTELSDITVNMGQGKAADINKVALLCAELTDMALAGQLPKDDAVASLEYFVKVVPQLKDELNIHISKLK